MGDDLRLLSRRWFDEVWNEGREETIDEMVAPGAVVHGLSEGQRDLLGPDAFRRFFHPFRAAFPDIRIVVRDVLVDGDKTAVRLTYTATHAGDDLGVPPTGRRVHSTAMVILRWRDGKIVEAWNEFDAAGLLRQLADPPGMKLRVG